MNNNDDCATVDESTKNALEALRSFAVTHNEAEFAHLCTAAISGDRRALDLVETIAELRTDRMDDGETRMVLRLIRETDTSRPDGSIARSFEI